MPTVCDHHTILPWGYEQREPTCSECLGDASDIPLREQERCFHWLRKRLKEDAVLLLTRPYHFFKKYPPHVSPGVVAMEELITNSIEAGKLEGPKDRYYVAAATGKPLSVYIVTVDTQRIEAYSARCIKEGTDHPLRPRYGVPQIAIEGEEKGLRLEYCVADPTLWKLKGPGVIFSSPVIEVMF